MPDTLFPMAFVVGVAVHLDYARASLLVQSIKNLPAMQKTWVYPWVGKIPWRRK